MLGFMPWHSRSDQSCMAFYVCAAFAQVVTKARGQLVRAAGADGHLAAFGLDVEGVLGGGNVILVGGGQAEGEAAALAWQQPLQHTVDNPRVAVQPEPRRPKNLASIAALLMQGGVRWARQAPPGKGAFFFARTGIFGSPFGAPPFYSFLSRLTTPFFLPPKH